MRAGGICRGVREGGGGPEDAKHVAAALPRLGYQPHLSGIVVTSHVACRVGDGTNRNIMLYYYC